MTRPNVVIICTDDLGWGDLGCQGSPTVRTPHIDALADRGVRMTQWYANSPVCSPSRAALLTGRHPAHAGVEAILGAGRGVVGLPDQPTLATRLKEVGYATGLFGKWHLGVEPGSAPTRRGFDRHVGFRAGCVDYYSHIMYWGVRNPIHDLWDDDTEIWDNGRYLTHLITDEAVAFVDAATGPFLAYVAYNAPHYPMHAPAEAMARFAHLPWEQQVMAAMIGCVDDGVGAVVTALERTGRLDDTVIVFTSDNGPSAEERNWLAGEEVAYAGGSAGGLRGHKGSVFEGGIRVPCIWSWPAGIPARAVCDAPAAMMDVLPTVLAAAGVTLHADVDGVDVGAALRGESPPDRVLAWEYESQLAVRHGRWKLVTDPKERLGAPNARGEQLFDLDADPGEQDDLLARVPEEVVVALRAHRDTWVADVRRWRTAPG